MRLLKFLLRAPGIILLPSAFVALLVVVVLVITLNTYLSVIKYPFVTIIVWSFAGLCLIAAFALAYRNRSAWLIGAIVIKKLRASVPSFQRELVIPTMGSKVTVTFDRYGIPTIDARSRLDAICALGYVTARDRLFQMDLLRREAAGRFSEIFGPATLDMDVRKRVIGFNRVASKVIAHLPNDQKEVLQSYTDGVNAYIANMKRPPFEFLLLNYRSEPWKVEDSILIVLAMFQMLCGDESSERMMTIMEKSLPPDVVAFLTPDTDCYTTTLLGGNSSHRPIRAIPVDALASVLRQRKQHDQPLAKLVQGGGPNIGSNCWAVDKSKSCDGRTLIANDIHLALTVPNAWYRAYLRYDNVLMSGVMLPGNPIIVAGSNKHVAWGITNMSADCLDLVHLEINQVNQNEYKTPAGWKQFGAVTEMIEIKGEETFIAEVKTTIWGPVSQATLLDLPVAIHWTALDPTAVDIGLIDLDKTTTVEDSVDVAKRFAGPPLNVIMADDSGHIGWTVCGKLPIREGFDGASAKSWAEDKFGWRGYIPPAELPSVIDPQVGFLATANNRTLGKDYPYSLGHNFSNGYRVHRIFERLQQMKRITEEDMFDLQLDTTTQFYGYYRELALEVLTKEVIADKPYLSEVRRFVTEWNGKADVNSNGLVLLICFREVLAKAVFAPFLAACAAVDEQFTYAWDNLDTPLQKMLTERIPELLPDPEHYSSWESFILGNLEECVRLLKQTYGVSRLHELKWGCVNKPVIQHPLAFAVPHLGKLLNMPQDSVPGCAHCICVSAPQLGSSVRMVVSPGKHNSAILHMPCGQSGHPLSPNYNDQHSYWVMGKRLPFLPGRAVCTMSLNPESQV